MKQRIECLLAWIEVRKSTGGIKYKKKKDEEKD